MAKVICIDNIDYPGYTNDEPETKVKKDEIKSFHLYYKIYPEDYDLIEKSSFIYYTIDHIGTYMNFGIVIKFIAPNTFILKNTSLLNIWSITVDDSIDIYIKDNKLVKEENIKKNNLWKLYNAGLVQILSENDL